MAMFKNFVRPREGRMVAGVCAGIARATGTDPQLVRLIAVLAVVFAGMGLWVYPLLWALMPEEGASTALADDLLRRTKEWNAQQKQAKRAEQPTAARPQEVFDPYREPRA